MPARGKDGLVRNGPRLVIEGIWKRAALTSQLTLSLTGEASAEVEVQDLHAFGEDEFTDIAYFKGGGENEEEGDCEVRRTACG